MELYNFIFTWNPSDNWGQQLLFPHSLFGNALDFLVDLCVSYIWFSFSYAAFTLLLSFRSLTG